MKLLFFFLLPLGLWAQAPACVPSGTTWKGAFTTAAAGTSNANNTANPNCNSFALTWTSPSSGVTALSIQLEGSDDNVTFTAFSGASTVIVGMNPSTALSGAIIVQASANIAYIRARVTTFTGSGVVNYQIYGYNGVSPAARGGGGGGGGGSVVTETWTAGTGGVTAGQAVCVSQSGSPATAVVCPLAAVFGTILENTIGIAQSSAIAGATFPVIVRGPATCTFDSVNAPTAGHLATYSLSVAGQCQDSGNGAAGFGVPVLGVVTATGAGTQTIYVYGSGLFASNIQTIAPLHVVNPSATLFELQAGNATGSMGSGTKLAFATGSFTIGDCLNVATNGSVQDAGAPCAGGSIGFNSILSGTNNTATMQVGSGAILEPTATSPGGIYGTQLVDGNDLPSVVPGTPGGPAVDYLQVTGAVSASPATVTVAAVGSDSNINLNLTPKGTGQLQINGSPLPSIIAYVLGTDIGGNTAGDCIEWKFNTAPVLIDSGAPCASNSPSFNSISSGTNNTATMTVTTGASLGPSGTGTITATQVPSAAGATTTTNGQMKYDTTSNNLHAAQNGADAKVVLTTATPGNGNCANWSVSGGLIKLGDAGSACGSGSGGGGGVVTYSGPALSVLTGTSFCPIGGGGACSATETNVDIDSSAAATVSNMYVQLSQALGAGNSVVVTWRDNATSEAVTCTISGASATACNDTTHSFNVANGDLLDYQLAFTGTIVVTPTILIMSAFGTSNVGITSVNGNTGPAITGVTLTIASGTATLGTGAIASAACATVVTVAGSGIATTDDIISDFNADPTGTTGYGVNAAGVLTIYKYPTSGNVNFKVCNSTGSSITPGSATLNWRVVR